MTELDAEDAKLVVLARGAMGVPRRAAAPRCATWTAARTPARRSRWRRCS